MRNRTPFTCIGVAIRLSGICLLCAILFLLDRNIPSLVELEYSRFQNVTLYLWLLVLPVAGYGWVLYHSSGLASINAGKRRVISVLIALLLSLLSSFATLAFYWNSG